MPGESNEWSASPVPGLRLSDSVIVVKLGGAIIESPESIQNMARDLRKWQVRNLRVLLVHGGGGEISRLQNHFGIKPRFVDGIRITNAREMPLVEMALCGTMNKSLVRLLRAGNVNAWGLSGSDAGLLQAVEKTPGRGGSSESLPERAESARADENYTGADENYTGAVAKVNPRAIHLLWEAMYLPVLAPTCTDNTGRAMNVNADEVALAMAVALRADSLLFVSDVEGVLLDDSVVRRLNGDTVEKNIAHGKITGGMIPKLRSSLEALKDAVGHVHIGRCMNAGDLDDLLSGRRGTLIEDDSAVPGPKVYSESAYEEDLPFPRQYGDRLLVLSRGEGCRVYDRAGKEYLDLSSGIAVNSLGYGREDLAQVAGVQMRRLIHSSNLFATEPAIELGRRIIASAKEAGFDYFESVHFGNSGTEANEAALKYARLYAGRRKGRNCNRFLAFSNAFHGRSMGSLSVTENYLYREPFEPLIPGVEFLPFNDVAKLEERLAELGSSVAALIVEPIQGEGGLRMVSPNFARAMNRLCRKYDIILIADEVQTGLGRCGALFACSLMGLRPDIICLAKPLAAGLPLSATLLCRAVHSIVEAGHHGSTFGGGPVTTALALRVWDILSSPARLEMNRRKGNFLESLLREGMEGLALSEKIRDLGKLPKTGENQSSTAIRQSTKNQIPAEIRGAGLLRGLMIDVPECDAVWCRGIVEQLREEGILVLRSGMNVLRFAPPLVMEEAEMREAVEGVFSVVSRSFQEI